MQVVFNNPKVSGDIPEGRSKHAMANVGRKLYIYGGETKSKQFNDFFVMDEKLNFREIKGENPSHRWASTMVAYKKKLYLFGGEDRKDILSDLYIFDTETETWEMGKQDGITPEPRSYHSACVGKGKMYIFGGDSEDDMGNVIYELDLETLWWERIEIDGLVEPDPMRRCCMVHHEGKLYVWGGWILTTNSYSDDLWIFDIKKSKWEKANTRGPKPEARGGHIGEVWNDKFFIFGGWGGGNSYYNSVHFIDLDDLRYGKLRGSGKVPQERYDCTSVIVGKKILVFGGKLQEDEECTNELFMIDVGGVY